MLYCLCLGLAQPVQYRFVQLLQYRLTVSGENLIHIYKWREEKIIAVRHVEKNIDYCKQSHAYKQNGLDATFK